MKKIVLTLTTTVIILTLSKVSVLAAPIWDELSACGTPLGLEHLVTSSEIVGFDDNQPWTFSYSGALPGDLSGLFTIELEGDSVISWWQQASDQNLGIYPAQFNINKFVQDLKPPPIFRMLHPYKSGVLMEPSFQHLEARENFDPTTISPLDFEATGILDSDYNNDGILGKWATTEQPLYIACVQKASEAGQKTGVAFPIYGRTQNKESAGLQLTSVAWHMATNRLVPIADYENDPANRFRKTTNREVRQDIPKYTPKSNIDCSKCEDWGGYLCKVENKRTTNIRQDCAQGKCQSDAQTIGLLGGLIPCLSNPISCLLGDTYNMWAYSIDTIPYGEYRDTTLGDARFLSALANIPDNGNVSKRFEDTYHVSKKKAELQTSGGFVISGSPFRDFNILYTNFATQAAAQCALWRQLSVPDYPGSKYSFGYLGEHNNFQNEQPIQPDFTGISGNEKYFGSLSQFCLAAERGITNIANPNPPTPPPPSPPEPPVITPDPETGDFVIEKTATPTKVANNELDKTIEWKIKIRAKYNSTKLTISNKTLVYDKTGKQIGEMLVDDTNSPITGWTLPELAEGQTHEIIYKTTVTKDSKNPYNLAFSDTKVTDTATVDAEKIDKPSGGTCGVCGIIGKEVKDKGVTWSDNGLVELLAEAGGKAVTPAGVRANVPAYVLAGILTWEGPQMISASKDQIAQWSAEGGSIPNCTINSAGAQGPFQIIVQSWDVNGWQKYRNAVVLAGERPEGYSPQPCNLKDAAYAAAAKLRESLSIFDIYNTPCEAYDETEPADCKWTKNNVIQATCHYYGRTGDSACSSVDVNEDGTADGNMCYSARAVYYQEKFICK